MYFSSDKLLILLLFTALSRSGMSNLVSLVSKRTVVENRKRESIRISNHPREYPKILCTFRFSESKIALETGAET